MSAANLAGGRSVTEHLLALGHRRIAVIGGHRHTLCGGARIDGYRSALATAGVRIRPGYVRYADWDAARAQQLTHQLLDLPEQPTAIFACSDAMAMAVLRGAAASGLRIPQELSVVGFGDIPEARWTSPGLTTVRQPIAEMAAGGMRMLVSMMYGEPLNAVRTELPTRLMVRSSTAPCAGAPGAVI